MKRLLHTIFALWCMCRKTADGICNGNSTPSDTYFTVQGTVPERTPCCFPFTYKGITLTECTTTDHKRPWCSVDSYHTNRWGNCVPYPATPGGGCIGYSSPSEQNFTRGGTADDGTPCCFPFWFKGIWYNQCTSTGHNSLWCSVNTVYAEENKLWGNCIYRSITPDPGSVSNQTSGIGITTTIPPRIKTTIPLGYWTNQTNQTNITSAKQLDTRSLAIGIAVPLILLLLAVAAVLIYRKRQETFSTFPTGKTFDTALDSNYEYVGRGVPENTDLSARNSEISQSKEIFENNSFRSSDTYFYVTKPEPSI